MADVKKPEGGKKAGKSDNKPSNKGTDSAIEALYIILFLFFIGSVIWGFLQSRTFQSFIGKIVPTSSFARVDTPIGEGIKMKKSATVYSTLGGEELGTQGTGSSGTVVYGPEFFDGERYWYVDFEDGPDGWVPESSLGNSKGGNFRPGDTPVGDRVYTDKDGVSVLYGPDASQAGTQSGGSVGTVARGPVYANGERYWYVDFDTGTDGWVKESDLLRPGGKEFDPGSTPVGEKVNALADETGVFEEAGGRRVGSQGRGSPGIIEGGPVYANGEKYWYVNFDDGQDGWVKESELLLATKETVFSKIFSILTLLFKIFSAIISILLLVGIVYSLIRTSQIVGEREKKLKSLETPRSVESLHKEYSNKRWEKVITHVQSENPTDWRLAVLEADIMLSEILDRMGYIGENLGEKLKRVEKSDFLTIDDAWEAHKVRNLIAHEGSDYILTRREAQRIVSLYANVFREFKYI